MYLKKKQKCTKIKEETKMYLKKNKNVLKEKRKKMYLKKKQKCT